jgi:hypothetical protein
MSGCRHPCSGLLAALVIFLGINVPAAELIDSPARNRRSGAAPWLTEVLAAELPKFVPPPTDETGVVSESAEPAVEREGVLSLPALTVRPVIKESPSDHAFLTAKGRMDLALKSYPGLRIGNILGLNNGIALVMQAEEQEVRAKSRLYHRMERVLIDDSANSRETRRMLEAALGRANASWLKKYPDR